MSALIGIDAGTSSVKVCAFGKDGTLLARASRSTPVATPRPRWAEIDLAEYWFHVVEALREVLAVCGPVAGVGFAVTAPTTVLMDAEGRALRPGIPFLDNRAAGELPAIAEAAGGPDRFFGLTGNRLSPSTCSSATVRWLMREEPEVWRRTVWVGFLNSYLGARLTGRVAAEWTQASYSGLFQLQKPDGWSGAMADLVGVPLGSLAELIQPSALLGRVTAAAAADTGLRAGTPVAIGSADTAAAAFAVGVREGGQCFESAGTSGVLTFCLSEPNFDDAFMNRCHVVPGRWLAHGAMSTPGAAKLWLREQVWPHLATSAELEALAASAPAGARGLVFLPYLAGERSPIWDPKASGAWVGLRLDTTPADMARAVYEGAAYGLRQILERGVQRWGWRPESLLGVGGGARSPLASQIKADVLGVDYRRAELPDAASLGAALMGGIAAGVYRSVDDPAIPVDHGGAESVRPGSVSDAEAYARNYEVYRMLYPAMREAMHKLTP